jgi:type II secretory pathway pseudopilin PulG
MLRSGRKKKFSEKGLTLIELLIYIAIFGALMIVITTFAINFTDASARSKIKEEVFLDTYSAMKAITYEIKRAEGVYLPTSIFDTNPGQLSLATIYGLSAGEKSGYIDFYLDNGRLYSKRDGQAVQAITPENIRVMDFYIEHLSSFPDSVKISLSLEYFPPTSKYNYSYSLTSVASLRK